MTDPAMMMTHRDSEKKYIYNNRYLQTQHLIYIVDQLNVCVHFVRCHTKPQIMFGELEHHRESHLNGIYDGTTLNENVVHNIYLYI